MDDRIPQKDTEGGRSMSRIWKRAAIGLAISGMMAAYGLSAWTQPPEGRFGGRGPGGPGGFGGPGGRGFPPMPLMTALDTDADGALSKDEIASASKSLMTLDKNKDGVISAEEMRPEFMRGGPGGPGGRGGPDMSGELVERMFAFDTNKDGKLSADELPERMKALIERADTNKDGFLDRQEVTAQARRQAEASGPQQGQRRGFEGEREKGERREGRGRDDG